MTKELNKETLTATAEVERNGKEIHSRSFIKSNTNFAALNVYISDKLSNKGTVVKQFMCFNFREKMGTDEKGNTTYAKKENKEGYATFAIAEEEIDHLVYLIELFLNQYKTIEKGGDSLKNLLLFVGKNGIKLTKHYDAKEKKLSLDMSYFHALPEKKHKKNLTLKFNFNEEGNLLVFNGVMLMYNGESDGIKNKPMHIGLKALELYPILQLSKNCY